MIELLNMDCIKYMATIPDKHFDLAVVDPPYGLERHNAIGNGDKRSGVMTNKVWIGGDWDKERPTKNYFEQLERVSINQIIWGGNYFSDLLPQSDKWLVWDKVQRVDQSDCELAWTSFQGALRIYQFHSSKLQGFQNPLRFHPTEKPISLYKWLLNNYAKNGDKVFDSHFGSGSIAIACHDMKFDLVGCEIDKWYYDAACKRLKNHQAQIQMF